MDALTLACVLADLRRAAGGRVRAVHADGPVAARLVLPAAVFRFDAAPAACVAWLAPPEEGKPGDRRAAALGEGLRAALAGSQLSGVAMPGGDRVARLDFYANRFGKESRHALVLEFMGKHANAMLLDGDGRILLAAREMNVARRGGPGEPWRPFGDRRDLATLEPADLGADFTADPPGALASLSRRFAGLHPELAADLAGLPPAALVETLRALGRFYATLDPARLPGRVRFETRGTRVTARLAPGPAPSPAEDCAAASGALAARLRKAGEALALARADAEAAEDFERPRRAADLMLTFADRVVRVAPDRAVVPGLDGAPMEVPLDPRFDLKGNRERLYRRYKRMKRARQAALERAGRYERLVAELSAALRDVEAGGAIPEIPLPPRRAGREAKRAASPPKRKGGGAASRLYLEERASTGHVLYIGRSARGNDYVTTRLSRPWDLWLHAKDVRGAHVVLRLERDEEPPEAALREAACVAAFHSEARNGSRILVSVTRRRDVRKVPGTPGLVLLAREETLLVEPGEPPGGGEGEAAS